MKNSSAERCARRLKVISDETRLNVLRRLGRGPRPVWKLSAELNIEQSRLSHHLKVLREFDFVVTERNHREIYYSIKGDHENQILDLGCCKLDFR